MGTASSPRSAGSYGLSWVSLWLICNAQEAVVMKEYGESWRGGKVSESRVASKPAASHRASKRGRPAVKSAPASGAAGAAAAVGSASELESSAIVRSTVPIPAISSAIASRLCAVSTAKSEHAQAGGSSAPRV